MDACFHELQRHLFPGIVHVHPLSADPPSKDRADEVISGARELRWQLGRFGLKGGVF